MSHVNLLNIHDISVGQLLKLHSLLCSIYLWHSLADLSDSTINYKQYNRLINDIVICYM
jgi:hypothetical protein